MTSDSMQPFLDASPGDLLPEARFTAPTDLCPHPERWQSTDSESCEREVAVLLYGLVRALQPRLVLETGTGFGEAGQFITDALVVNGHGHLVTVEADRERADYAAERLRGKPVTVVYGDSMTADLESLLSDGPIELAWFDSYYKLRVPEFRRFRPLMRRGTIVGFHDTAPGHAAVPGFPDSDIRSTIAAGLRRDARLVHLPTPRGVTIGEVL